MKKNPLGREAGVQGIRNANGLRGVMCPQDRSRPPRGDCRRLGDPRSTTRFMKVEQVPTMWPSPFGPRQHRGAPGPGGQGQGGRVGL